jgi:hypothetical protein
MVVLNAVVWGIFGLEFDRKWSAVYKECWLINRHCVDQVLCLVAELPDIRDRLQTINFNVLMILL